MVDVICRLATRVQLTTDGHRPYLTAVPDAFGDDIDYAMLVKLYSDTPGQKGPERKYSPGVCKGARKVKLIGNPIRNYVSTSHAESLNQKIRAQNRRFTRLTAGHSKKFQNHVHHLAIYFVFYNFARMHSSIRMSPAMAAGIETRLWDIEDVVRLMDATA